MFADVQNDKLTRRGQALALVHFNELEAERGHAMMAVARSLVAWYTVQFEIGVARSP